MAGIGWKLQRLIDRGSLAGTIGAYLTGVAVTSAPWLLTTAVLTSLRIVARRSGTDFAIVERFLTLVYAVTVILSAPIHVVVSRYTADRLYDHHLEKIGAPLRRATAMVLVGFALCGVLLVTLLKLPLALAVVGAPLTAIIGAQWLMLSVGGGMTSPMIVMRAFGIGAPLSLVFAWMLDTTVGLGAAGYLYGFAAGQLATLAILVQGVARAVPGDADESARLAPAFREYRLLALSALAYYVSIWADKIVVYLVLGGTAATFYAAIAAVAWFSVIPAFAWIYVQIETSFYRRFRAFYADIEIGAPLRRLQQGAEEISAEARRILRGAGVVQASASGIAIAAAPFLVHAVGLSPNATVSAQRDRRGGADDHAARGAPPLLLRSAPRRPGDLGWPSLQHGDADLARARLGPAAGARLPAGLLGDVDVWRGAGPPPLEHAHARYVPVATIWRVVGPAPAPVSRA
jgi:uncharacterized membrane protein